MLHVVNNKPSIDEISAWLNDHSVPIPPTSWQLVDAQKMNREHPDTFHIPTEEEINMLTVGSFVKLGFEVNDDDATSERMWVEVTARENDDFIGELNNDPATIRGLKYKDVITFKALNIMSVEDGTE